MVETWFGEDDDGRVIEALREWAKGHPRKDRVFCSELEGSRVALTPMEYLYQVEERTPFGRSVLQFLNEQARLYKVRPEEFVRRAADNARTRPFSR